MPQPVPREVLWGSMALGESKRRVYLFRVDPAGLLAIRIGNPLSWSAFFATVLLFFIVLAPTPLGWASLFAGGAVGMLALGLLDRGIARALATQPRDRLLKSRMNVFLPKEDWATARVEEGGAYTFVEITSQGRRARIAVGRPRPPQARQALRALVAA